MPSIFIPSLFGRLKRVDDPARGAFSTRAGGECLVEEGGGGTAGRGVATALVVALTNWTSSSGVSQLTPTPLITVLYATVHLLPPMPSNNATVTYVTVTRNKNVTVSLEHLLSRMETLLRSYSLGEEGTDGTEKLTF